MKDIWCVLWCVLVRALYTFFKTIVVEKWKHTTFYSVLYVSAVFHSISSIFVGSFVFSLIFVFLLVLSFYLKSLSTEYTFSNKSRKQNTYKYNVCVEDWCLCVSLLMLLLFWARVKMCIYSGSSFPFHISFFATTYLNPISTCVCAAVCERQTQMCHSYIRIIATNIDEGKGNNKKRWRQINHEIVKYM